MPPTYSIWSNTTIILVGSLNMVRGTTITNADSFNVVESTVTGQPLSNTPLAPTFPVTPNHSADVAESAQSTAESSLPDDEHSSPLHQSSTEASERQHSLSPRQSTSDETTTNGKHSPIETNRFESVYVKIKDRLKRAFSYFCIQHE